MASRSPWTSSLLLPVYLGGVSAFLGLLHFILLTRLRLTPRYNIERTTPSASSRSQLTEHIGSSGGLIIWAYKFVRFFGCLALAAIALLSAFLHNNDLSAWVHGLKSAERKPKFTSADWVQISLAVFYVRIRFTGGCLVTVLMIDPSFMFPFWLQFLSHRVVASEESRKTISSSYLPLHGRFMPGVICGPWQPTRLSPLIMTIGQHGRQSASSPLSASSSLFLSHIHTSQLSQMILLNPISNKLLHGRPSGPIHSWTP